MEFADGAQDGAALLLAIKDNEINTLRQQLSQLADDLKRNVAVLSTKDDEAIQLRSTVDGMRALLAEKDILFAQFQAQVEELEALRIEEAAKRVATEQLLASQQQDWKQQQGVAQKDKDAEINKLQQQLKESEERWSTQLMQIRQAALDESIHRSTQQQSAIDRAAENEQRLQQQLETLGSALAVKEAELDSAHRQLATALQGTQRMEAMHAKTIAMKESVASQLQQQLDQQTASIAANSGDHETNMAKLIASLNQMQESCKAQALEVQEYAAGQKRLQDERKVLKEQLKQQEAAITKLQTEKGVLEAALQHEVTAQAGAQAQLNIFQAKLAEAVMDLEKRCAAAEARSFKLTAQLVEERGRLVDAVIEQANSSTPQLAAELAKSLEADRLRTQAELQVAQERSRSLAEDLALIRSTLMPLVTGPAASGAAPAAQQANGSLAALAQMMQHGVLPGPVSTGVPPAAPSIMQLPMSPGTATYCSPRSAIDSHATYTFSPSAAAQCSPAAAAAKETECQAFNQQQSPARSNRTHSAANSPAAGSYAQSPSQYGQSNGHTRFDPHFISSTRSTPQRGSLAGLVCDLQADVDKLQQQLHSSRKQLRWEGQQSSKAAEPAMYVGDRGRPGSLETCHHYCNSSNSPVRWQQEQHCEQHQEPEQLPYTATPIHCSHQQQRSSSAAGNVDVDGSDQLTNALKFLLEKTEQLSAENGALKVQLEHSSPSKSAVAGALSDLAQQRLSVQQSVLTHSSSIPYGMNRHSSNNRQQHRTVLNNYQKSAAATTHTDCCSELSQHHDDSASVLTDSSNMGDDLSIAASEELAAAQAAAAAEYCRRRRQARAAAAARKQHINSPNRVDNHQYHSPVKSMLARSGSLDSRDTLSDISSCSTLSPLSAAATGPVLPGNLHGSINAGPHSSSRQLLETVLASYPHNSLGKLMKQLVSTVNSRGGAAAAAAAAAGSGDSKRGSCSGQQGRSRGLGSNSSSAGANSTSHAALLREQLRHLADLSPTRQHLLRALAGAE